MPCTVKSSALTVPTRRDGSAFSREESDSDREHIRRQAFARSRFRCEAKDGVVQEPVGDMRRARRSAARKVRAVSAPGRGAVPTVSVRVLGSTLSAQRTRNLSRKRRALCHDRIIAPSTNFRTDRAPMTTPSPTPGNRGVNDPSGARGTRSSRPSGVVHATVPIPSPSEPRSGRHKTPPRVAARLEPQVVAASAPSSR
jgi:hypothetical protein